MTVQELIEQLQQMSADAKVEIEQTHQGEYSGDEYVSLAGAHFVYPSSGGSVVIGH